MIPQYLSKSSQYMPAAFKDNFFVPLTLSYSGFSDDVGRDCGSTLWGAVCGPTLPRGTGHQTHEGSGARAQGG